MKQRYFLEIAYDGSNYFGWQIQPKQISVQEAIQKVLSQFYNQEIKIVGCGRTDTGVHAKQYFTHFDAPFHREKLENSLRLMFPEDISLLAIHKVSNEAHSRFDATERSYTYYLHHGKDIFNRQFSLATKLKNLNFEAIEEACKIFVQEKNYEPLSKKNDTLNNYHSMVSKAIFTVNETKTKAVFEVTANRYLHNQIRRMLGTLLNIGQGKLSVKELEEAMQNNTLLKRNDTVPSHGLFLHSIKYPYI
ncbi:MAG: tRNA pseudouridine(38-40) synthase TruA [Chitinophagales bacterium]